MSVLGWAVFVIVCAILAGACAAILMAERIADSTASEVVDRIKELPR